MATIYTEIPQNFCEIATFVEIRMEAIKDLFFGSRKILFYDACSFQRHSYLEDNEINILLNYFKHEGIVIFITRCILMELASDRHKLAEKYIEYIKKLSISGIQVAIFNEEYTYDILSDCFSTNERVNEYLMWAVRTVKSPIGTITETFKTERRLFSEIVEGKNLKASDLYTRFFVAVRSNKEHHDNLGEELIAVCVHILSCLPGVTDGKLCILTDDKGAVSKFKSMTLKSNLRYQGAKVMLFSTPKLVQHMYQDGINISQQEMEKFISQGAAGNVAVMGMTACDLKVDEKISMTCEELVRKIMEPNGIKIVF